MFTDNGINHAANLPAVDNKDLQVLLGTRLSEYIIFQYRRTLALHLILDITDDVNLCQTITYICEDHSDTPDMSDSAINGPIKRKTLAPPRVKSFSGFCKGGFETKLSVEQLECINQSEVLSKWYNGQMAVAISNGRNAIMARFYRHMLAHVHPKNTGLNAGQLTGGQVVGLPSQPVLFDVNNADKLMTSMLNVIKQMPETEEIDNHFGRPTTDAFFFGHQSMESVFMHVPEYQSYDSVGSCANCSLFKDVFDRMPRGLMPITSFCVESRTCNNGSEPITVYPVLFGKRYKGTKASLRVKTYNYVSENRESVFYRVNFYHHIHTYDCRFLGAAWITIRDEQPETIQGCQ